MEHIILPKKKAEAISNGVFLIALSILFFSSNWWPGILLAIWSPLAVRQYFTGRYYDLILTTLILFTLFILNYGDFSWALVMPLLLMIGGIYIIFREVFFADELPRKSRFYPYEEEIEVEYPDETNDKVR